MGAYYPRATSVASSSVPQSAGGANPVTPSPMVSNPMLGGTYLGLTSTAGATPMGYSTLVPPSTARSAIPSYGGYSLSGLPTANLPGLMNTTPMGFGPSLLPAGLATGTPQVGVQATVSAGGLTSQTPAATTSTPGPSQSLPQGGATPTTAGTTTTTAYGDMPSRIKNAVKMIQPFYSEGSTVEKARAFWNAFERATVGLEEQLRLSAFRECLKGKTAEDWWMYSLIPDFGTLCTRFHNQFVCLTPLQMIERLKNAKRTKGMSAEVWGDLISGLCNEAQCYDPQMRYQYFLSGLRNREWKAALNTLMVNSIEGAVIVLLAKNMHQPVEDDAAPSKPPSENAARPGHLVAQCPTEETSVAANPEYARLFTPDELDALEAGRPSPAAEEKEEYDKEIEERLFPLDEVELLKKTKKTAAKEKELTLEELSSLLNLTTLAASEEAKRANRDFKAPATAAASTPRVGAVQPDWSDGLKAEENDLISEEVMNVSVKEPNESPPEPVTDERLVAGNICVAFSGSEVEDPPQEDPVKIPFRLRSLIRTVVYQIVLEEEARSVPRCPACLEADTSPSDDSSSSASTRLYAIVEREARARLLTLAAAGVLGDRMMEAVIKQIMESYSEEAPKMRAKRTARSSR
ncbi:hypothetical protein PF010_g26594, partial [Phytophthora fragariae]